MTDVVVRPSVKAPKRKPKGVRAVKVQGANGEWETRYEVDGNSPEFGTQFLWVFQQGVNKAIAENEKLGLTPRDDD